MDWRVACRTRAAAWHINGFAPSLHLACVQDIHLGRPRPCNTTLGPILSPWSRAPIEAASALVIPWSKHCTANPDPNTGRIAGI